MKPATTRVARLAMDRGWCVGWGEVGRYVCGGWRTHETRNNSRRSFGDGQGMVRGVGRSRSLRVRRVAHT